MRASCSACFAACWYSIHSLLLGGVSINGATVGTLSSACRFDDAIAPAAVTGAGDVDPDAVPAVDGIVGNDAPETDTDLTGAGVASRFQSLTGVGTEDERDVCGGGDAMVGLAETTEFDWAAGAMVSGSLTDDTDGDLALEVWGAVKRGTITGWVTGR